MEYHIHTHNCIKLVYFYSLTGTSFVVILLFIFTGSSCIVIFVVMYISIVSIFITDTRNITNSSEEGNNSFCMVLIICYDVDKLFIAFILL